MKKLIFNISSEWAEMISDILAEHQALAVTLQDNGDQALFQEAPQETPLWQDTRVEALFSEDDLFPKIIKELEILLNAPVNYQLETLVEENWVEKSQANFPVLNFCDKLWVAPPWQSAPVISGTLLRINPGLGFGTGAHPTTALCLKWLVQQTLPAKIVVDYGCGSGILGLSALALGAKQVWAIDHDPQALTATRDNANLNSFSQNKFFILPPEEFTQVKADIILANILANPICELAPRFIQHLAPGGVLILSGFLESELARVLQVYTPNLQVLDTAFEADWVRLALYQAV